MKRDDAVTPSSASATELAGAIYPQPPVAGFDMRQLTFTRFIAAMSVVFLHWAGTWPALNDLMWKYRLHVGPSMVGYFFVLSGFIMAAVYFRTDGKLDRGRYWAARFARVYPVYVLGVLLMAIPMGLGVQGNHVDPIALILNLLVGQAWSPSYALSLNFPGWSLSVEGFFYLAFPFLVMLLARMRSERQIVWFTALLWLASQFVYEWSYRRLLAHDPVFGPNAIFNHNLISYSPLAHLNQFVVGVCAGVLVKRREARIHAMPQRQRNRAALLALSLSGLAIVLLMTRLNRVADPVLLSTTNGLIAPLFAIFIAALSIDGSRLSMILRWSPFVLLGEISYAVYVLQLPVAWAVRSLLLDVWQVSPTALFASYLAVLLASSYLVFRYYETPLRTWLVRRLAPTARR